MQIYELNVNKMAIYTYEFDITLKKWSRKGDPERWPRTPIPKFSPTNKFNSHLVAVYLLLIIIQMDLREQIDDGASNPASLLRLP